MNAPLDQSQQQLMQLAEHVAEACARIAPTWPLDQFIAERITGPLGMQDTRFYLDQDRAPRLAAQYRPGEDQRIVLEDPAGAASRWVSGPKKLFRGAGGMVSASVKPSCVL